MTHLTQKEKSLFFPAVSIFLPGLVILLALLCGSCEPAHAETGYATYYTEASCKKEGTSGIWTASRERFDEKAMNCALRSYDFGKKYLVYSPDTNKSIVVTHTDFGPGEVSYYQHGNIIDLSPAAMNALGINGRGRVSIQEI